MTGRQLYPWLARDWFLNQPANPVNLVEGHRVSLLPEVVAVHPHLSVESRKLTTKLFC